MLRITTLSIMTLTLIAAACGKTVEVIEARPCTVSQTATGGVVTCPDGSSAAYTDGATGGQGVAGPAGANGAPCAAYSVTGGISLVCPGSDPQFIPVTAPSPTPSPSPTPKACHNKHECELRGER